MSKLGKFIKNPGLFFRDFLIKKYPIIHNQLQVPLDYEKYVIEHELKRIDRLPNNLAVDVVFTWVDDKDPKWLSKKNTYLKNERKQLPISSDSDSRFCNHDELIFSLFSVKKYLPWVRKIFVVTDNQIPEWIEEYPQVQIVDHKDIIDCKYLPTFNSHVIESSLHKIQGLSEHFIYFNDDVFVARELSKSHFFSPNGISSIFSTSKSITNIDEVKVKTPTSYAIDNSLKMLKCDFDVEGIAYLVHTYVPLRKKYIKLAWSNYRVEIEGFMGNRFRGKEDLNLATFLCPWLAYYNGDSFISDDLCHYFNIRSSSASSYLDVLSTLKKNGCAPHSFCANDFDSSRYFGSTYKEKFIKTLSNYYK